MGEELISFAITLAMGFICWCCCVVASESDEIITRWKEKGKKEENESNKKGTRC